MFCVAIVDKSFPIFDHFIVQFQFVSLYGRKSSLYHPKKSVGVDHLQIRFQLK
jgi:hypothetical protein